MLVKMLDDVINTAIKKGINKLVCIVDNEQIKSLFIELGFSNIDKKIFINEEKSINTAYSNSTFLAKML